MRKVYFGAGAAGRAAAEEGARRRAERQAEAAHQAQARADHQAVEGLGAELRRRCELLADLVLVTSGYSRPRRKPWRRRKSNE